MTPPKARMAELVKRLGILDAGREVVAVAPPGAKQKKTGKHVLRKHKTVKPESPERALRQLTLNPPHGKKDAFEKITVTLPSPIRRLLLDESHQRKTERDPNWSISVIVREALAAYLGAPRRDRHQDGR